MPEWQLPFKPSSLKPGKGPCDRTGGCLKPLIARAIGRVSPVVRGHAPLRSPPAAAGNLHTTSCKGADIFSAAFTLNVTMLQQLKEFTSN